tara:strand:- start:483 stop:1046 length:564 start_codon:yes stop_codon:yes gene_type:complete
MAYTDIAATEARGMWSPPNGAAPQMLPDQWKDNPEDELRTDLPDKTDDELVALGWKKVDLPSYETNGAAFFINSYEWNSETRVFDATELEDFKKLDSVDYNYFWIKLLDADVYATMKTAASSALAANTLLTEFIALLEDAKRERANTAKIQASISGILAGITFSADELAELQTLFDSTGMSAVYTLS